MRYKIIENDNLKTINFFLNGKLHTITSNDKRFDGIISNLDNKEIVSDLLNFKGLETNFIKVKKDRFLFKEEKISEELLIKFDGNTKGIENFLFNIESHFNKEKSLEILNIANRVFPYNDSCMKIFVSLDKNIDLSETPFYAGSEITENSIKSTLKLSKKNIKKLEDKLFMSRQFSERYYNSLILLRDKFEEFEFMQVVDDGKLLIAINENNVDSIDIMKEYYYNNKTKRMINQIIKADSLYNVFNVILEIKDYLEVKRVNSIKQINKELERMAISLNIKTSMPLPAIFQNFPEYQEIYSKTLMFKDMQLVFPTSSEEVVNWGNMFNNCYGGRASNYFKGAIKLLGLKDNSGTLMWVLEVRNNKFGDFETYNKVPPTKEFKAEFSEFLRQHKVLE
jgi:hypothetical protein